MVSNHNGTLFPFARLLSWNVYDCIGWEHRQIALFWHALILVHVRPHPNSLLVYHPIWYTITSASWLVKRSHLSETLSSRSLMPSLVLRAKHVDRIFIPLSPALSSACQKMPRVWALAFLSASGFLTGSIPAPHLPLHRHKKTHHTAIQHRQKREGDGKAPQKLAGWSFKGVSYL